MTISSFEASRLSGPLSWGDGKLYHPAPHGRVEGSAQNPLTRHELVESKYEVERTESCGNRNKMKKGRLPARRPSLWDEVPFLTYSSDPLS